MISATTMNFGKTQHANVVFKNGAKMISISLDNNSGAMSTLARADIRLFSVKEDCGTVIEDITSSVFGGEDHPCGVDATIDNMSTAMKWLQRIEWGMDAQMML